MEKVAILGLAVFNGVFVVPQLRRGYRYYYQQSPNPTHYCFFDIDIDGKPAGRLDFELFGEEAPKTVNNFLAFATGGLNSYMWFKGSRFHRINS